MTGKEAPAKRRLFVGTFLAEQDKERLAQLSKYDERLSEQWKRRLRWVRADKLHLTWLFLGTVEDRHIPGIRERLSQVVPRHSKTSLEYNNPVFWPSPKYARTLVVVPNTVPDAVRELQSDIQTSLREFVAKEEKRAYRPHITLMRLDPGPPVTLAIPDWLPLENRLPLLHKIDGVDLIESHLGRGHDRYESLYSFRLQ